MTIAIDSQEKLRYTVLRRAKQAQTTNTREQGDDKMFKTMVLWAIIGAMLLGVLSVSLTSADGIPALTEGQLIGWTIRQTILPARGRVDMAVYAASVGICDSQAAQDNLADATLTTDGLTVRVIQASRDRVNGAWCILTIEEVVPFGHGTGDTVIHARADWHFLASRSQGQMTFRKVGTVRQGVKSCNDKGANCHTVNTDGNAIIADKSVCEALRGASSRTVKFEGVTGEFEIDYVTDTPAMCALEFGYALRQVPSVGAYILVNMPR